MAWPDRSALMDFVAQLFSMLTNSSCFVWNVRGLNDRARRNVVKEFVLLLKPTIVCIQETKLSSICNNVAVEIVGAPLTMILCLLMARPGVSCWPGHVIAGRWTLYIGADSP